MCICVSSRVGGWSYGCVPVGPNRHCWADLKTAAVRILLRIERALRGFNEPPGLLQTP